MNRRPADYKIRNFRGTKWGYVEHNPVSEVEGFPESKRDRYITDKEFEPIKEAARATIGAGHLPDIMDVLYYTAQRSGRIFRLRWSQVDLDKRRISLGENNSKKKVSDEIWISQPVFEILSRLKAERGLQKVVGPYVLQKANGKPYGTIKTTWKNCCRKAEITDAHVHDIRHKAITDMGKRGYTIQQIAKIAGHSQISTTMRYTHLRAEDTRDALESLGRKNETALVGLGS